MNDKKSDINIVFHHKEQKKSEQEKVKKEEKESLQSCIRASNKKTAPILERSSKGKGNIYPLKEEFFLLWETDISPLVPKSQFKSTP